MIAPEIVSNIKLKLLKICCANLADRKWKRFLNDWVIVPGPFHEFFFRQLAVAVLKNISYSQYSFMLTGLLLTKTPHQALSWHFFWPLENATNGLSQTIQKLFLRKNYKLFSIIQYFSILLTIIHHLTTLSVVILLWWKPITEIFFIVLW